MSELSNLVELLGAEAALKLIELHGGTRLNVPKVIPADHPLRDALRDEATSMLQMYFGGSTFLVPIARQWRAQIYKQQKKTNREIARLLGCTEKAVYQIFAAERVSKSQMCLPLS